jgi:hypothetical protein
VGANSREIILPWVTINGAHVLIGEDNTGGGGHTGMHNPAVETGNKVADHAANNTGTKEQSTGSKIRAMSTMELADHAEKMGISRNSIYKPSGDIIARKKLEGMVISKTRAPLRAAAISRV